MNKKIFRSILLVSSVVLFASIVLVMGVLYDYFKDQTKTELVTESSYIASAVNEQGINYLNNITDKSRRITYVDSTGKVLFDNTTDISTMNNHLDREEISEALTTGTGQSVRMSDTLLESMLYYAQRLDNGDVIRISAAQNSVLLLIIGMLQPTVFIIIIMIILSALFASRVSKRIVKPINEINLDDPVANETYDEITPLLTKISKQNNLIKKQLNEAKRKQEEFEVITENMSEGILVIDKNTHLISNNSAALKLLDSSLPEDNSSVLAINRSDSFREVVEASVSGKHSEKILKSNGLYFQLIANPVKFDNKVAGAVIVILDVTEKEKSESIRREFTANVSHELKTPLTSISGFAELMKTGTVKPQDVVDFSGSIYDESQRLITLVNDIIKISVLDENGVTFDKNPIDLSKIAKETIEYLNPVAEKRNISLSFIGETALVKGNYKILSEMIYNICENAIKYNKENGKVDLIINENENEIKFIVRDTGIGIPLENQPHVFDRFYRVDKSHSKEIGGTGLGLSIVKHAAAFHNLGVMLDSEENVGTTITIVFKK